MTSFQRSAILKKFKETQVPFESIYNLIPDSVQVHEVHPRYQSKFKLVTRKFYESEKKCHQTMGYVKASLKTPKEYLKKRTKSLNTVIERKPFICLNEGKKKPPIPKRDEPPHILHETNKNFVKINKLNVLKTPALKPTPKAVDTRTGDCFLLEFSGLVPKFSNKEDFGKTPNYLVKRRKSIECSHEMFVKSFAEKKHPILNEEEKIELIEGLRANWEELNTRYQTLPLVIDTKILQNRKLELEKKLKLLEKDIFFLEKNKDIDIYVLSEGCH